jgi:sec-independent protein translocase protein TatB
VFDIGATELLLVAIIGLVVVGPERLPRLARTVGLWVKKLRGQVSSIQKDINRELELEDLKRQLEARGGGLKMEDITGDDPLGLNQSTTNTSTEKNERSKPE